MLQAQLYKKVEENQPYFISSFASQFSILSVAEHISRRTLELEWPVEEPETDHLSSISNVSEVANMLFHAPFLEVVRLFLNQARLRRNNFITSL
jgi:hypothetical protein